MSLNSLRKKALFCVLLSALSVSLLTAGCSSQPDPKADEAKATQQGGPGPGGPAPSADKK